MKLPSEQKRILKTFVLQYSQAYCGLACLASITQFHGGYTTQEHLQKVSGTNLNGTSMLGLYHAAQSLGFTAAGFEAEIEKLKAIEEPVILHTVNSDNLNHFVVCYSFHNGTFTIGDPAKGIVQLTEKELHTIWKSKALLKLSPGQKFKSIKTASNKKRQWIIELIRPDLPLLTVAAILGILISLLNLATAIFTQKLIDQFLPSRELNQVITGLALLGFVLLGRAVLSLIRSVLILRQGKEMNYRLIGDFFSKLLFLPKPFFDSTTKGDMVARLNDAQRIQKVVVNLSSQVAIDLLIVLTSVIYIFILAPATGFIVLGAFPLFGGIAWHFNSQVIKAQKSVMQNYATTETRYIDTLQGIYAVKAFNSENWFSRIVSGVYRIYLESIFHLGMVSSKMVFWITIGSTLWMTLIISSGIYLVWMESIRLGEMMAIITIAGSLGTSLVSIAMSPVQFQEARIAFDRMFEFSSSEPEYSSSPALQPQETFETDQFSIQIRNVSFRFPGKSNLLSQLNLTINHGELIAIFGEVGSGKTTLLDLLMRMQQNEQGSITLNNEDWNRVATPQWRKMIAVVPQHVGLFNATILENIAMEENPDPEGVVNFCRVHGFHHYIMELQQGYATVVNENSSNLSGGQRQLIALARAMYKKPKLLLLDEATAAMDRRTEQFVMKLLMERKSHQATVMVTHRADLASLADTVYVIDNKKISVSGHPEYVKAHSPLFSASFAD